MVMEDGVERWITLQCATSAVEWVAGALNTWQN
jgi:hypothetical protein